MNKANILKISGKVFTGFSILSLAYVSILSLVSPQATMELVQTPLTNTDAISSIRGIYGGVGLVITVSLIFLMIKNLKQGLAFLTLFWGAYALSRIITIVVDGPLGDFGTQWLTIEITLCLLAAILFVLNSRLENKALAA